MGDLLRRHGHLAFYLAMVLAAIAGTFLYAEQHRASDWRPVCVGPVKLRYAVRVLVQPVDWHVVVDCSPHDMGQVDVAVGFQTYLDAEEGRTATVWHLIGNWTGLGHGRMVVYE